ncbi:MAG: hypothetical protein AAFU65_17495, partial [Pseudomonadota bacterium]
QGFSIVVNNAQGTPTYAWSLTEVTGNVSYDDDVGKDVVVRSSGSDTDNSARLRCVISVDGQTITVTSPPKTFRHETPVI